MRNCNILAATQNLPAVLRRLPAAIGRIDRRQAGGIELAEDAAPLAAIELRADPESRQFVVDRFRRTRSLSSPRSTEIRCSSP